MNKYESIIIINPNCTEEAVKALESKFKIGRASCMERV